MKEQHREQKLFPQLLQLRCGQAPKFTSDIVPTAGTRSPLLSTGQSHPGEAEQPDHHTGRLRRAAHKQGRDVLYLLEQITGARPI